MPIHFLTSYRSYVSVSLNTFKMRKRDLVHESGQGFTSTLPPCVAQANMLSYGERLGVNSSSRARFPQPADKKHVVEPEEWNPFETTSQTTTILRRENVARRWHGKLVPSSSPSRATAAARRKTITQPVSWTKQNGVQAIRSHLFGLLLEGKAAGVFLRNSRQQAKVTDRNM